MKSYTYCITNDFFEKQNFFKIGYTTNLKRRKKDFDTDTLNFTGDFKYITFNEYSTEEEGRYMERQLHKLLQTYRIKKNKEWFFIENKDLIRIAFDLKSNYKGPIIYPKDCSINDKILLEKKILELSKDGNSIRKIAKILSLSKSKVGRIIKNNYCKSANYE